MKCTTVLWQQEMWVSNSCSPVSVIASFRRGVCTHAVHPLPRLPPYQPLGHHVVESAQHPPDTWGHHPCLRPVHHYRLDHHQVYLAWVPGIRTLSSQYARQLRPLPYCLLQVADHRWPVFVRRRDNSPYIFESGDRGEGDTIFFDCHISPHSFILLHQATAIPPRSPPGEGRCHVPAIDGLVWQPSPPDIGISPW